jgi:hypothetical protein
LLEILAEDEDMDVREAVVWNDNTPVSLLEKLAEVLILILPWPKLSDYFERLLRFSHSIGFLFRRRVYPQ